LRPFLLVNANISRPPVSPVGLEYVAEALLSRGVKVEVVDLAFEADWKGALRRALSGAEPLAVGVSVRNTDDCSFSTRRTFLPWLEEVAREIKGLTDAPLVLGGVGFSVMPEAVLARVGADLGIDGDGEEAAFSLARALEGRGRLEEVPGLLLLREGKATRLSPKALSWAEALPPFRRDVFDNPRYEREGAMVGVETKRGCPEGCVFCADPVAKGRRVRERPPKAVAEEVESLARQGVTNLHLCDSEFNIPLEHAKEVCRELIRRRLGERIRWFCYCSPLPFDGELARLMREAGCAGINFGVDSLYDPQLRRLGRRHSFEEVRALVSLLRSQGLNFMFDLLLGGPGETTESVRLTVERAKSLDVPVIGVAVGVRLYPGTPLGREALEGKLDDGLKPEGRRDLSEPAFYCSPALGEDPLSTVREFVGDDPRFLLLAEPSEDGAYNYADDEWLYRAIVKEGERGAYWDIIRRRLIEPRKGE